MKKIKIFLKININLIEYQDGATAYTEGSQGRKK